MYDWCLNTWNDLFIPRREFEVLLLKQSTKQLFLHLSTLSSFHVHAHTCSTEHVFRKWEIFAPLALTTTPKPGKRYKIWQMNCYFKSSTSASNQHERMLHGNLPCEPPSRTRPASTSVLHRAKKQITSKGHQICSPLQKPLSLLSAPPSGITKTIAPSLILKRFLFR